MPPGWPGRLNLSHAGDIVAVLVVTLAALYPAGGSQVPKRLHLSATDGPAATSGGQGR